MFLFPLINYLNGQEMEIMENSTNYFILWKQLKLLYVQVWDNTELVPHEESNKVYLRLNFKLHIYFAAQKINHDLEPISEISEQVLI